MSQTIDTPPAGEQPATTDATGSATAPYDVVIVGAGVTGMYQLLLLRRRGLRVRVVEGGGDVGGTWYWNRYPGARLDSESFTYQYAFDEELLAEWDWAEMFAGQPELLRYFNRVADKHDLRRDIQFGFTVQRLVFDEERNLWEVHERGGEILHATYVIAATGVLSALNFPDIPGLETFEGEWHHTGAWPHEEVALEGKKVVVIGTGATGIQVISEVGKVAEHLTVFQRTPNWAIPLRNRPLSAQEMAEIRADYPALFPRLQRTFSGFMHEADPTTSTSVPREERLAHYEDLYQRPGFAKWQGVYHDVATDETANREYGEFLAGKIRDRVDDPEVAAQLIPTDHLFGTKRVPCETNYFETYNRPNVELVSLKTSPILEYTPRGVRTPDGEIEADVIIIATGFEAFTGALNRIEIRGVDGLLLREKWEYGPLTYMGVQVADFPNFFIMGGPHGKGGHGNSPRCSEKVVEWMADFAAWLVEHDVRRVEADPRAEKEWSEWVYEIASHSLMATANTYVYGDNIPGRPRAYLAYSGSLPDFVQKLHDSRDAGWSGFVLTR
ncbi:NAD(P)/FAD-dependent oxidoreductase [Nocardioides zeae]|uniref:NAD(P)/FAD-dependent oxidoreductase n=1 Tax=Nocardioides imazamoxiresistens TaxID=3231893 RepID=A0ABU3PSF8_9ACTN|nr:NAD(P)/FAD-dependent oxidoreductase [Nocardioides zeae]MDT9592163.1 NAD(P)/FAD-dependent oxidoreductase [Nocardioides zeae]